MPDWDSLFEITLPIGELVVRGTVLFLAILLLMRVVGQREAGGLGLTDVLLVVLVAEAAAPGLYGDAGSVGDALVLIVTIVCWSIVVDAASFRWPRLGRVLKARSKVLVSDGRINRHVQRRELVTDDEVAALLRLHGVEDLAEVRVARIEPNGMVSVLLRDGGGTEAPEPPKTAM